LHNSFDAARTSSKALELHADRSDDRNSIRRSVAAKGTKPNIPPKAKRIWKIRFSRYLHRDKNAIERMFCRLRDFRRVATRDARFAFN
jgi:transposase